MTASPPPPSRGRRRRARAVWALAALPLAAVLAGCSAHGGEAGPEPAASSAEPDPAAWAACMRRNGVDVGDPGSDGRVKITGAPGDDLDRAEQACRSLAPAGTFAPGQEQAAQDRVLAYTRCMREHGIDLPDPRVDGDGRIVIGGPDAGELPSPDSPQFREAEEACRDKLGEGLEGRS